MLAKKTMSKIDKLCESNKLKKNMIIAQIPEAFKLEAKFDPFIYTNQLKCKPWLRFIGQ